MKSIENILKTFYKRVLEIINNLNELIISI